MKITYAGSATTGVLLFNDLGKETMGGAPDEQHIRLNYGKVYIFLIQVMF